MGACVSKNGRRKSKKVPENDKKYKKNPNRPMAHEIRRKPSRTPSVPSVLEESELEVKTEAKERYNTESDRDSIVNEPEIQEIIDHRVNSSVTLPLPDTLNEKPLILETQDYPEPSPIEEEPPTPQHLSPKEKIRFRRDFFLKDILDPPSSNSYQTNLRNSEVVLRNNSSSLNEYVYLARETYPLSKVTPAKPKRTSLGQSSPTDSENLNKETISLELEESGDKIVNGKQEVKESKDEIINNINGKEEAKESGDIVDEKEAIIVSTKVSSNAILDEQLAHKIVQNDIKSYAEVIRGKVTAK